MLGELSLSDDASNPMQEIREHLQFQRRKLDGASLKRDTAGRRIHPNSPVIEGRPSNSSAAAYQRAEPRSNLRNVERFGYVVISAGVEAIDLLGPGPARREDEHRNVAFLGTPPFENLKPLHLRQPEIKNDGGIRFGHAELVAIETIGSPVYDVTGLRKSGGQPFSDLVVVLDQQNANVGPLSVRSAETTPHDGAWCTSLAPEAEMELKRRQF